MAPGASRTATDGGVQVCMGLDGCPFTSIAARFAAAGGLLVLSWLAHWIERHPGVHRFSLRVWRLFPPRIAGFLKGRFARNWLVGAVAVMVDAEVSPPELLLVEHSYRARGAWGLPGGSLESIPGDPRAPRADASPDDVIEATLRREVLEELGIDIQAITLLRVDAVPYVAEEPGPYRLDFYFRCEPEGGFGQLRTRLQSGSFRPRSAEILSVRLVPLTEPARYDLFSPDARFIAHDLPRLVPGLEASAVNPSRVR
jgi:8-oxo-dGTP pyrophosphatase MutT (NUDIX family)